MSVGRNSKGTLELMTAVLRAQFTRYEISWQKSMLDIEGDALFDELEELFGTSYEVVKSAKEAVNKALDGNDTPAQSNHTLFWGSVPHT